MSVVCIQHARYPLVHPDPEMFRCFPLGTVGPHCAARVLVACLRYRIQPTTHVLACAALIKYTSGFETTLRSADTTASLSCSCGSQGNAMSEQISRFEGTMQSSPQLRVR